MTFLRNRAVVAFALWSAAVGPALAQSGQPSPARDPSVPEAPAPESAGPVERTNVANGPEAYQLIPGEGTEIDAATIQPSDKLSIKVLGETDLSSDQVLVDGAGNIQLLLVGTLGAAGMTVDRLRTEIAARLAQTYIRDPQVSVTILERAKASITVEGEVKKPGRIDAPPGLTLLGAIATCESTTTNAALAEVIVFRQIHGRRTAARFNLKAIRQGLAPDPQIIHGDTIVVGRSFIKGTWHDVLAALPALNIFYLLK